MRKNYLLIAIVVVLGCSCKKETKELTSPSLQATDDRSAQSVIGTGCYGNVWADGGNYYGGSYLAVLVYNDKTYVFQRPGPGNIMVFDGTTWTTLTSAIPYPPVRVDFAFVIGNKGYLGFTLEEDQAYYEYNFDTNTWTAKGSFPGSGREHEACFSIGNKGYIVGGWAPGSVYYNDTWEYNAATNGWTQKAGAPFSSLGRANAAGFTIGNKGYIVGGDLWSNNYPLYFNTLFQYDPSTDTWTSKASFPGAARAECQSFVISGMGYVGGGYSSASEYTYYKDFYKYNPSADTWTQIPLIPGLGYMRHSFAINSKGYVAYEYLNDKNNLKMEKYTPLICPPFNAGTQ